MLMLNSEVVIFSGGSRVVVFELKGGVGCVGEGQQGQAIRVSWVIGAILKVMACLAKNVTTIKQSGNSIGNI